MVTTTSCNRSISIALLRRSRSHGYTKRVCLVTTTKKRDATSGGSNVSGRGDRGLSCTSDAERAAGEGNCGRLEYPHRAGEGQSQCQLHTFCAVRRRLRARGRRFERKLPGPDTGHRDVGRLAFGDGNLRPPHRRTYPKTGVYATMADRRYSDGLHHRVALVYTANHRNRIQHLLFQGEARLHGSSITARVSYVLS